MGAGLGNWIVEHAIALGGGLLSGFGAVGGVVHKNRKRSMKNQRQLQGDPDDPNSEGVLQIVHRLDDRLEEMQDAQADTHRDLRRRIEELDNDE